MPSCSRCGCLWGKLGMNRRLMRVYIVCFASMFATGYTITMLFPFLPFMVAFLLPEVPKTEVAKYAGYVASAVFAGRFVGCYIWGAITDYKGRKPVLVASGLLLAINTFVFGFSVNYEMAIVFRFFIGLSNGAAVASRAAISDTSTDANQAIGLSLLSCAWGVGLVLGPALSGLTADPITQYNLTLENGTLKAFLTTFPFATPCILSSLVCCISVILTICLLPETYHAKVPTNGEYFQVSTEGALPQKSSELSQLSIEDPEEEECGDIDLGTLGQKLTDSDEEDEKGNDTSLVDGHHRNHGNGHAHTPAANGEGHCTHRIQAEPSSETLDVDIGALHSSVDLPANLHTNRHQVKMNQPQVVPEVSKGLVASPPGKSFEIAENHHKCTCSSQICLNPVHRIKGWTKDFLSLIKNRLVLMTVGTYCALSFSAIGFDELYSLWTSTPISYGGLGFTAKDIGLSLAVAGGILLPIGLVLYPLLERKFRSINTFQMNAVPFMLVVMLFPFINRVRISAPNEVLWVILIVSLVIYNVTNATIFSAMSLLINNSVTKDKLGSVNGLAISSTSLVRTAATSFTGGVYSFSLRDPNMEFGYPVDYHLVFVIFGFVILLVIFVVACLPESINHHMKEEDVSKFDVVHVISCTPCFKTLPLK